MHTSPKCFVFMLITFFSVLISDSLAAAADAGNSAAGILVSIPIPEPSTVAVFGLAAVALLRRRRRQT